MVCPREVPCALEEHVYFPVVLLHIWFPYWLDQICWLCLSLRLSLILLITERGVLKSPIIIVELSDNFCSMCFGPLLLGTYTVKTVISDHYILTVDEVVIFMFISWVKFLSFDFQNLWIFMFLLLILKNKHYIIDHYWLYDPTQSVFFCDTKFVNL